MADDIYRLNRQRTEALMRINRMTEWKELGDKTNIKPRQFTRWAAGGDSKMFAEDLGRLADELGTTMDYLVGRSDNPGITLDENALSEMELKLIAVIRAGYLDEALDLLLKLKRGSGSAG